MTAPTVRVSVPAPIYTRDPFGSRFSRCSISSCEYPDTPRTLTFDESGYTVLYTLPGDSHDCSIPHLDSTPSLFQPGHILPAESDCAVKSDCSATLLKPTILSLHLFRFGFCEYCCLTGFLPTDLSPISVSTALAGWLTHSLIPSP